MNFMISKYDIIHDSAPKIDDMIERIKKIRSPNEDFLRSFLMIAVSTFLCPPTSLEISPRCYPALVDLGSMKKLNWCQFVVDQLKEVSRNLNKKNAVRGCVLVLVVSFFTPPTEPPPHPHLLSCLLKFNNFLLSIFLFFLQILYADSLAVDNVQIPDTKPRIAAWTRQLLDKVIRLDRNRDGSFGKLKVHFCFLHISKQIVLFLQNKCMA